MHLAHEHRRELDAAALYRGIDLWSLPLAQALNLVYLLATMSMDETARARFDSDLSRPEPGSHRGPERGRWSAESELADFRASM